MNEKISIKNRISSIKSNDDKSDIVQDTPICVFMNNKIKYEELNHEKWYSSRADMIQHRKNIIYLLNNGKEVTINLQNIHGISHSAADELIGVLALHYGAEKILNKIKVSASDEVMEVISKAFTLRNNEEHYELNEEQLKFLCDSFNTLGHGDIYLRLPVDTSKFLSIRKCQEIYNDGFWELETVNPFDIYDGPKDEDGLNKLLYPKGTKMERVLVPDRSTKYYCPLLWDYYKGSEKVFTNQGREVPFKVIDANLIEVDNMIYWDCKIIMSKV